MQNSALSNMRANVSPSLFTVAHQAAHARTVAGAAVDNNQGAISGPAEALTLAAPASGLTQEPTARLILGDAWDAVPALPRASIDVVITSPPYWGQRSYGQSHNGGILAEWLAEGHAQAETPSYEWYRSHGGALGMEPIPDWYAENLAEILSRCESPLKTAGSLWVVVGDTYFARWSSIRDGGRQGLGDKPRARRRAPMGGYRQEKQLLLIPARFAIAMQNRRWILRNDVIWSKPNVPPRPERDRLRLAHEHVFHFVKRSKVGRPKYYYDLSETEPGSADVVTYNVRGGGQDHSATFPESLVRPRIKSTCPPGGTVLDPFCGTGTSLAVAVESGRSAIGIDVVERYLEMARRRMPTTAEPRE